MRKIIMAIALVGLLAAGCSTASGNTATQSNSASTSKTASKKTTENTSTSSQFSMADVQAANSADKCWTVVNGSVYDLTKWIKKHPGGAQAILSMCGKDGTADFNKQHAGQKRPEQELASLKIGTIK